MNEITLLWIILGIVGVFMTVCVIGIIIAIKDG